MGRWPEDEGYDLWRVMNRVAERLERGDLSDHHVGRLGKLCSVRPLRGICSKVDPSKGLWGLAGQVGSGQPLKPRPW
jgi:hypothetical protein